MPLSLQQIRAMESSVTVHGRKSSKGSKKKSLKRPAVKRGTRAGFTMLATAAKRDAWGHKDTMRKGTF